MMNKQLVRTMMSKLPVLILAAAFSGSLLFAQNKNHSYPRIAIFHFGDSAPAYWYSKFDVVDIRSNDNELAQAIRTLNPNAYIFGTKDWNNGSLFKPTPAEYKTYLPNGSAVFIYGSRTSNFTANFSDFCGLVNGKRYSEALPQATLDKHDQRYFDGIATDGLWLRPREAETAGAIDLDRNGRDDYAEHGKDWVNTHWKAGVDKVIREINRLNNNRPLLINSGRFHEPAFYWEESNGMILENSAYIPSIDVFKRNYSSWMKKAREPHLFIVDGLGNDKKDYVHMRYLLGMTLFGDGYFSFSDNDLHHYHYYFDEYDVDLGQPSTDMELMRDTGNDARGVYVRFFSKGAVIVNASASNESVSDSDISRMPGYNGPYFRFKGGQDPALNSGARFSSVNMSGELNGKNRVIGDAILLTKAETVVVADLIVDNNVRGTNPGSEPAAFSGSWIQDNDNNDNSWALSYRGNRGDWAVAYASPGSGETKATFTPTIGVPGKYYVYEWHGRVSGRTIASDTPYEIRHAGGTTSGRINQRTGQGKWNLVGEFDFGVGRNGYVRISNNANGTVIADAFMFVYNEGLALDSEPPRAPTGVKVRQ